MKFDILIAGVGGQGQVLASRILGAAAIADGKSARTGETIGMAQRGGCVVSNVRIGDVSAPTVPIGEADLLIGFELCETARNLSRLAPGGKVILNRQMINPITVSLGFAEYDAEAMLARIRQKAGGLLEVDAVSLAGQAGSARAANVVLLGAAAGMGNLPFPKETVLRAVEENVAAKFHDLNVRAFELGFDYAQSKQKK
ncbi:MAG TPA: indolepyruvate oxidoreductase subunit beta [Clostridia bacterium]|nr:indolepyruvate oxidoreductase subunit beta [Clostridia bacterium]